MLKNGDVECWKNGGVGWKTGMLYTRRHHSLCVTRQTVPTGRIVKSTVPRAADPGSNQTGVEERRTHRHVYTGSQKPCLVLTS